MPDPLDSKAIAKLAFGLYPHVFQQGEGQIDGEAIAVRIPAHRGHRFRAIVGSDSGASWAVTRL